LRAILAFCALTVQHFGFVGGFKSPRVERKFFSERRDLFSNSLLN
jgi:hypothetical protein